MLLLEGINLGLKEKLIEIYDKKYKELMIITFIILIMALGVLAFNFLSYGEFIKKGVSLKGGLSLTVSVGKYWDVNLLRENIMKNFPNGDASTRSIADFGVQKAVVIESSDISQNELIDFLKTIGFDMSSDKYSVEQVGSKLGQQFYRQMMTAVIVAFIFMGIVVLITFRALIPSLFVILAATADILSTLAVISLMDVKLSMAGIGAFLMLIGYSVDTDMLLTARVLRRKEGSVLDRTLDAMRTGLAMSLTSFFAVFVAYFFTQSDTIKQIMLILSIGLLFDIFNTWIQNAGILRWYLEWKNKGANNGQA